MVAGLSVVRVLRCVSVFSVVHWVLVTESVVVALVVLVLDIVVRNGRVILLVDRAGVSLVLKFYMGLFLVCALVVRVEVSWCLVMYGMIVHNVRSIIMLVVCHALDEVVR